MATQPTLAPNEKMLTFKDKFNNEEEIYLVYSSDFSFKDLMKVMSLIASGEMENAGDHLLLNYINNAKSFSKIYAAEYAMLRAQACVNLLGKLEVFEQVIEEEKDKTAE